MGSGDGVVQIDVLERGLLSNSSSVVEDNEIEEDEPILYSASFQEMEGNYVKYQTAQWVLYSLLLVLAWGIGLFMFLYIPVRRFVLGKEFRSRKLYITPNAIVYKVTRPVPFPCFGVLKKEKHVLLPSIADIVIEQGYLQSYFGIYSIRIENVGVRRPSSDDVQIHGIANPREFRKVVLTHLANIKNESVSRRVSRGEGLPNFGMGFTTQVMSPSRPFGIDNFPSSGELILQKLDEVGSSVKFGHLEGIQNYLPAASWIDRTQLIRGSALCLSIKSELGFIPIGVYVVDGVLKSMWRLS
ncbi:hypothetical protein BVC80_209g31 [Macleaya cordata]|uniref:DUF7642 domain-containing protein n=1 Tax=Macleaya cordata TaxID=56857 RepID=A0A200QCU9_MACCD|nr:hypothetical protein BVC80_209g31 [Macleaya cordata]